MAGLSKETEERIRSELQSINDGIKDIPVGDKMQVKADTLEAVMNQVSDILIDVFSDTDLGISKSTGPIVRSGKGPIETNEFDKSLEDINKNAKRLMLFGVGMIILIVVANFGILLFL